MNAGESLRDQGERMLPVRPRKHGPEAQNRRQWSAERRARHRKARTAPHTRGLLVRLPALHSPSLYFRGGGKGYGVPGAANNTGGGALAVFTSGRARGEEVVKILVS